MERLLTTLTIVAVFVCPCAAEDKLNRIDFKNDLIPVLTKHGCNAGACHGAAIGRGGFKLSLYGGDPKSDFEAIAKRMNGRRINLSKAGESLVVLKPTEQVEHGGGSVFDDDSESARLLLDWIKQGAEYRFRRDLKHLEITPNRYVAKTLGESVPLRAIAYYSDGSTRDVTKWTIFQAEDESAVRVAGTIRRAVASGADSPQNVPATFAEVLRRGRHIVVARYLGKVVPIEVILPLTDSAFTFGAEQRSNFIDDEILETLAVLGLPTSPVADDATFLRRISLDLTGRLPKVAGTLRRAVANDAEQADGTRTVLAALDRAAMIDKLLTSDEFTDYWTLQLAKLLRIRPQKEDGQASLVYHAWLSDQVRDDVSYQQLARDLILANGDSHQNGPANFHLTVSGPREQAEFVSELFMGSRLRCANCHNHPLDRWTQDDYHGLAAIFAQIERGRVVGDNPNGSTIHPRTLAPAVPKIPGEPLVAGTLRRAGADGLDRADGTRGVAATIGRSQLADWLTGSSNPYFAKAIVNRLWRHMMGRGLVEPVDDFRDTNPATHPELLNKLAEDFSENGYSIRHTLRLIANSTAYARSANAIEQNKDDDRFYSHAYAKPLEPEVLADAISDVVGVAEKYGNQPDGTRAVMLVNPKTPSRSLDILGRCGREESCESPASPIGGLPQKLHLFNGPLLNARIAVEGSRLSRLHTAGKLPMEIVKEFYLAALGRQPSDRERERWKETLASLKSTEEQRAFLEDFVWGLMTCNEFTTNH